MFIDLAVPEVPEVIPVLFLRPKGRRYPALYLPSGLTLNFGSAGSTLLVTFHPAAGEWRVYLPTAPLPVPLPPVRRRLLLGYRSLPLPPPAPALYWRSPAPALAPLDSFIEASYHTVGQYLIFPLPED